MEFNVTPPVWLGDSAWFWPTIAAVLAFKTRACDSCGTVIDPATSSGEFLPAAIDVSEFTGRSK
jgi:hypothetical protein